MKKSLKVFLGAAIVLSAVACSTANDEETKTKETKEKVVETKEDTSVPNEMLCWCIENGYVKVGKEK